MRGKYVESDNMKNVCTKMSFSLNIVPPTIKYACPILELQFPGYCCIETVFDL
jgi:hypothetical protein